MTREEAIAIRTAQLAGKAVDPMQAQEALIVIRNTVHERKPRPPGKPKPPPKVKQPPPDNPFGLADMQVKVMDLVILGGTAESIAAALGVKANTVHVTVHRAMKQMRQTRLMAALLWDRYRRTPPTIPRTLEFRTDMAVVEGDAGPRPATVLVADLDTEESPPNPPTPGIPAAVLQQP